MPDQFKMRATQQVRHIVLGTAVKVVHTKDIASGREKTLTQMRTKEPGAPGH